MEERKKHQQKVNNWYKEGKNCSCKCSVLWWYWRCSNRLNIDSGLLKSERRRGRFQDLEKSIFAWSKVCFTIGFQEKESKKRCKDEDGDAGDEDEKEACGNLTINGP